MDQPRPARQLAIWAVAAVAATLLLAAVLRWERRQAGSRFSPLVVGDAQEGLALFASKGCVSCHGESPSSPSIRAEVSGPAELVSAMWNHAPEMWRRMEERKTRPPALDAAEMANVFAFLYAAGTLDQSGDAARGASLFGAKGCAGCHDAPSLASRGSAGSPVAWAAAVWNHPKAEALFAPGEMSHLFAFLRGRRPPGFDRALLAASAERGWRLFREKGCASCHGAAAEPGGAAPDLAHALPPTVVELAGAMWNHAAGMRQEMERRGLARPAIDRDEMTHLAAFLYGVRYAEPGGAPRAGEVVFTARRCETCHGAEGRGGPEGPALRGRGRRYSAIALAATLWRHGPEMSRRTEKRGLPWPTLDERDVGDLIAFLNTPPDP